MQCRLRVRVQRTGGRVSARTDGRGDRPVTSAQRGLHVLGLLLHMRESD